MATYITASGNILTSEGRDGSELGQPSGHLLYTQPSRTEILCASKTFDSHLCSAMSVSIPKAVSAAIERAKVSGLAREKVFIFASMLLKRRQNARIKVSDIVSKGGIRLASSVLRRVFAERTDATRRLVLSLGLIKQVSGYSTRRMSKGYWFEESINLDRRQEVEISDRGLRKRLQSWRSDYIMRSLKHVSDVYSRELVDLTRLSLSDVGRKRLEITLQRAGRNVGALPVILERLINGHGGWFCIGRNGRVSTHITGCPANVREELCLQGELVVEWDIPSSHPSLILADFSQVDRRSEEFRKLVRLFQTGMFYEAFHAYWQMETDGTENAKVLFQKIVNDQRPSRSDLPMFRELVREFPIFMSKIVALKRSFRGKGAVARVVQGREAQLIHRAVALLHKEGIPCFTCYDSVGVPLSFSVVARDILNREIERTLGFRLCVKTKSRRFQAVYRAASLPLPAYPEPWSVAA